MVDGVDGTAWKHCGGRRTDVGREKENPQIFDQKLRGKIDRSFAGQRQTILIAVIRTQRIPMRGEGGTTW